MNRTLAHAALALGLAAAPAVAGAITADALAAHTRFLASDLLEGRGPGSRGDELTRAYLATQLEAAGLEPGGTEGSWEQRFSMVGIASSAPAEWRFESARGAVTLAGKGEFIAGSGVQAPLAALTDAEVVFVGYGIEAPEHDWDDFKGVDLRGKVLLMLNNDPDWDPELFAGKTRLYYGRWTYKYESAARQGAAGAIIVHTTPSAGYPWQVVESSWSGEQFELPDAGEARLQVKAWTSEEATRRLLKAAGHDFDALSEKARSHDFRPVPLGLKTSLAIDAKVRSVETANVLGLLRGGDSELADEVVVYSGHHDHLGMGSGEGDVIHNGAIDNATGCAQLLGIARAFAALPERPRRSILFAFVAAEEQGLLGSRWFAEHPTFPPGKIAANVNLDAGNVFGPTADVTYIGYGKSSLDAVIEAAAAAQGRRVIGDTMPDRGFFYRSDQFNFARIGVPALYIDGGKEFVGKDPEFGRKLQERYESTCYHQPCDEFSEDWDFSGLVQDAELAFACGRAIADADAMPRWNPGDEFEARRLAELDAVAGGSH
ncbi:MAG: hypothetical protein AMXMBFR36_22810 [Acidobacteriota bacterium]